MISSLTGFFGSIKPKKSLSEVWPPPFKYDDLALDSSGINNFALRPFHSLRIASACLGVLAAWRSRAAVSISALVRGFGTCGTSAALIISFLDFRAPSAPAFACGTILLHLSS